MKYKVSPTGEDLAEVCHLQVYCASLLLLIEKDGGIGPCDVLATCYLNKVLNSTQSAIRWMGQISESQHNTDFSK